MRAATAIRCDDVDDLDTIEAVTVECYRCDPDNPLAVPRETCAECRGTGRAPVSFVPILREIRESRTQPGTRKNSSSTNDDDLCLEY